MKQIKMTTTTSILTLRLEDFSGVAPTRTFILENGKQTNIPITYAKSIFNYRGAAKLYRDGVIKILAGEEELVEKAQEEHADVPTKVDTDKIVDTLLGNDITAIKELFQLDNEDKDIALELALENRDRMSTLVVREIEKITNLTFIED